MGYVSYLATVQTNLLMLFAFNGQATAGISGPYTNYVPLAIKLSDKVVQNLSKELTKT